MSGAMRVLYYLSLLSVLGVFFEELRWTFAFLAFLPFGFRDKRQDSAR